MDCDIFRRKMKWKNILSGCVLVGAIGSASADWTYNLPETGLMPSAAEVSVWSDMSERHGKASSFGMQQYDLAIPLSDPRRTNFGAWAFNAALDVEITALHASGSLQLRKDELYNFNMPLTVIRRLENGKRLALTLMPSVSTDFSSGWSGVALAGAADYQLYTSETLTYSVGLFVMPQRLYYGVAPFFSAEWKPSHDWTVKLKGYRLEAMYAFTPRFSAGPVLMGMGNSWAVRTERGNQLFTVRSMMAGVTGEYDFAASGQRKRIIKATVGSILTTTAELNRMDSGKHTVEAHHYHPGLYVSVGVDCRF